MGRIGITADDVIEVAEHIVAKGDIPTIEKVRIMIGTGSNSTIAKHLNAWKQQRLSQVQEQTTHLQSPPDPVNQAVNRVWQQLQEESEAQIQQIKAHYQTKEEELLQARDKALHENTNLTTELDQLRRRCDEYKLEHMKLEATQQRLEKQLAVAHEQVSQTEKQLRLLQQESQQSQAALARAYENKYELLDVQMQQMKAHYEQQCADMKEYQENLRHHYIVEVDNQKVAREKAEEQLQKTEQERVAQQAAQEKSMMLIAQLKQQLSSQERWQAQIAEFQAALHVQPKVQQTLDQLVQQQEQLKEEQTQQHEQLLKQLSALKPTMRPKRKKASDTTSV